MLGAMLISMPAQAACWSEGAIEAAKVRDLETMMMVSALRCRQTGHNFLPDYNRFVRTSRVGLVEANNRLRAHFAPAGGLNAYDRWVTSLANRYGGGAEGLDCADMASIVAATAHQGASFRALLTIAERADVQPVLGGHRCTVTLARAGGGK
jgi:hypothetical protein